MQKKKRELIQALGTYNAKANLNDVLIKRHKTQMYDRQINLSERVESWNDEVFQPKVFEVNLLNHPALNDNILFRQIKQTFLQYNKEALGIEPKINQQHVKSVKMTELLKVMINIIEVDDKETQLNSLKKAHKWMKDNLKVEPDKYQSIKKHYKPTVSPKKIELPKIPSNQIEEEIRDYKDNFRTYHNYAPKDRIKYYKRRQLNFDDSLKNLPLKSKSLNKPNKIKYLRPQTQFGFQEQHEVLGIQGIEEEQLEVPELGIQNVVVQVPVVEFDNQAGEDEQVEPELPEEDAKVGKLNPRTKVYTYPDDPDYQKSEIILEQHFKLRITKQQRQAMQDYESQAVVRKLADTKGRLQTQLNRKLQSLRQMTKMAKINNSSKIRSLTETSYPVKDLCQLKTQSSIPETPYEQLSSQLTVKDVKKTTASALSFIQRDIPNQREGLSMFGKKKHYENKKWLSLILKQHQSNEELQFSLDQIEDIKTRLTQIKIPFELKKIYEGILKPSELTSEAMTTIGHPEGKLLSNPDFKVGKKKKKKKKK